MKPSFLTTALGFLALGSSAADATTAAIELKPINLLFSQPSHRRSGNSGDLPGSYKVKNQRKSRKAHRRAHANGCKTAFKNH